MEKDHEAVCDIVFSYEKKDFNRIINKFIKELIMILPSNISNLIIQKKYINIMNKLKKTFKE